MPTDPVPESSTPPPGDSIAGLWKFFVWCIALPVLFLGLMLLADWQLKPRIGEYPWRNYWFVFLAAALTAALLLAVALSVLGGKRGSSARRGTLGTCCVFGGLLLAGEGYLSRDLIPQKQYSADKSVLSNLRGLSAAADQYFLENNVSTVDFANLVGSSNYLKAVNSVAGETYPRFFTQNVTITVTGIAGTRVVTYAP